MNLQSIANLDNATHRKWHCTYSTAWVYRRTGHSTAYTWRDMSSFEYNHIWLTGRDCGIVVIWPALCHNTDMCTNYRVHYTCSIAWLTQQGRHGHLDMANRDNTSHTWPHVASHTWLAWPG